MNTKPRKHYCCFVCLRKLGFGYDRTARHFGLGRKNVIRWFKYHGVKVERPTVVVPIWRVRNTKQQPLPVDWEARLRKKSVKSLRTFLRTQLWKLLKHGKCKPAEKLVGCTLDRLKEHLASKFQPGMTLDGYCKTWEVDHIIPVAAFNLYDPKERAACFHFSNLQPLTPHQNAVKGVRH